MYSFENNHYTLNYKIDNAQNKTIVLRKIFNFRECSENHFCMFSFIHSLI